MSEITLDADTSAKLQNLGSAVKLCDPSGKVLGKFVPAFDPSEWEFVGPDISEEEMKRREKSDKWYTTQQVLDILKKMEENQ
jgi:hypothetical protein